MTITERVIRDAKPGEKTRIEWDSQVKGFGLRVTATGALAYILNYRVDGRERRATIGRPSEMSLKAARDRATAMLAEIRTGGDPLRARQKRREAPTVNEGLDRFFNEYVPRRMADGRMTKSTCVTYGQQAASTIRPALGKLKIADVTRADIERAIRSRGRVSQNRILALLSRLFNLFEAWELRLQHTNPCRGIEKSREEARDRVLSPSELAALARALNELEGEHPAPVAAIRLASVTGLRIGEVLAIQWEHVDFETGRLIMPTTKTGRRSHDLPAAALQILANLPRINAWALSTGRNGLGYRLAHTVFTKAAKHAGLADVRLHDLRRSFMTNAAVAGVGTHILRDLLGHKTTAMADRYIRSLGTPVRDAREQVGSAMAAMMRGESGEVVPMRERRDG